VVVDLAAARLYDIHILVADTVTNLDSSLAIGELLQLDVGGWNSEVGADALGELRVRGTAEDYDVANHGGCPRGFKAYGQGKIWWVVVGDCRKPGLRLLFRDCVRLNVRRRTARAAAE
jgi:hypothetical protein